MSRGIPKVRSWKVTAKDTGKVIFVDTINRKFARWIANTERGMYGHELAISVVKETPKPSLVIYHPDSFVGC